MDSTIDALISKNNKLTVEKILEELLSTHLNMAYIFIRPEANDYKAVHKPTRFYLSKAMCRALQIDIYKFINNELQIAILHCIETNNEGMDPVFLPLPENVTHYTMRPSIDLEDLEFLSEEDIFEEKTIPLDVNDNFCIIPKANTTYFNKFIWNNLDSRMLTTSICEINPKNVYVYMNGNNKLEFRSPDLETAIILSKELDKRNISPIDTTVKKIEKILYEIRPEYKNNINRKKRIIQIVTSGISRRGRPQK